MKHAQRSTIRKFVSSSGKVYHYDIDKYTYSLSKFKKGENFKKNKKIDNFWQLLSIISLSILFGVFLTLMIFEDIESISSLLLSTVIFSLPVSIFSLLFISWIQKFLGADNYNNHIEELIYNEGYFDGCEDILESK